MVMVRFPLASSLRRVGSRLHPLLHLIIRDGEEVVSTCMCSRHRYCSSEGTRQGCSFVSQSFAFCEILSGYFF
jgi:hypothetical protein